jgi:nucleoside-diphosphate-sugar epimerase
MTTTSNVMGTLNVLIASRDEDVDAVVVASSSSVYGSGGDLPRTEEQPLNPESPYGLSKHWTDRITVQFSDLYGLDTVALRYFNVFGPDQNPEGQYAAVIPKFIRLMLAGERPTIFGDGEQSRDFTFIENALQANIKAAESDCAGEALNVACGGNVTVNALVDLINDILGTDIEPIYEDPRPGDVRHSHAEIGKARKEIGYDPTIDFREGLERTVESFRD